jgi:hypothetical protein
LGWFRDSSQYPRLGEGRASGCAGEARASLRLVSGQKSQLRYFGLRPDIVRGTFEVCDLERAKERVSALSETECIKPSMVCAFTGYYWYRAAWALYRMSDPAKAAVELARFYDEAVVVLGFVPLMESTELLGQEAEQWRTALPILAGFVRGQLRAGNRFKGLPGSEEELMSFVYEAWCKCKTGTDGRATTLANEVERLWQEFRSRDTEYDHWRYLHDKKGESPKRVGGVQELSPHAALNAASYHLEDEELTAFERQETLRQNSQHLTAWVERAGFAPRQQEVYESDMRNNFNAVLGASELGMSESAYKTHRARYIVKLREIAASQGELEKISQSIA